MSASIAWTQRGISAHHGSERAMCTVHAFTDGVVLLTVETPGIHSNHHLTPAGCRALAEALNHAATVAEIARAGVAA